MLPSRSSSLKLVRRVCVCACVWCGYDGPFTKQASNIVPMCAMCFLSPRAVPVFVTVLLLVAVTSSGVMSAMLPCANSLSENPFSCDGVIVYRVEGKRYSVGMWAAAFMAGVIGTSGNLILVPYLSRFRGIFTSAYLAGTGVSGIIASALAAAQVWKTRLRDPNFGVDVFCAVVAASCTVSLVAWLAVVKLDYDYEVLTRKEEWAERRRRRSTLTLALALRESGSETRRVELDRRGRQVRLSSAVPPVRSPVVAGPGPGDAPVADAGGGVPRSPARSGVGVPGIGSGGGGGGRDGGGGGGEGGDTGGRVFTSGSIGAGGRGGGSGGGGVRLTGGRNARHGDDAADDPLLESLLTQQQQCHARMIDIEASEAAAAAPLPAAAAAAAAEGETDGESNSENLPFRTMLSRIWPVVLINCLAGLANYGMSVPAAAVAAEHRVDIFPSLPTLASITYYVASPFGFGLAGLLPNWTYSPAVATWVVAMGFIVWAALAAAIPTALGRQVQTTGLLVAIVIFGLANPYVISEGFRWCQNLHMGERPARVTACAMQLGSALGALISFYLF